MEQPMTRLLAAAGAAIVMLSCVPGIPAETDARSAELDAFWAGVAGAVATGDFEGYSAAYHPDAILVNEAGGTSYPIAAALKGWEQGFDDTAAGRMKASVEFRFTKRLNDETTAYETGIFHYSAAPEEGDPVEQFLHFEALLVNKNGWKMMMEYQKAPATMEEWVASE
jgi:ketosteroid isomerase-like protein